MFLVDVSTVGKKTVAYLREEGSHGSWTIAMPVRHPYPCYTRRLDTKRGESGRSEFEEWKAALEVYAPQVRPSGARKVLYFEVGKPEEWDDIAAAVEEKMLSRRRVMAPGNERYNLRQALMAEYLPLYRELGFGEGTESLDETLDVKALRIGGGIALETLERERMACLDIERLGGEIFMASIVFGSPGSPERAVLYSTRAVAGKAGKPGRDSAPNALDLGNGRTLRLGSEHAGGDERGYW